MATQVRNAFATTKVLPAIGLTSKKKAKTEVVEIEGLDRYGAVDALIKALEGIKDTLREPVTEAMTDRFIAHQENFKAAEGKTTASCQMKVRSVASGLEEHEIDLLVQHGISFEEVEKSPETLEINPDYRDNPEYADLLNRVGQAVAKVKGVPADFFVRREAVTKVVVTEDSLKQVFSGDRDEEHIRRLLPVVSTLAIRASRAGDVTDALGVVYDIFGDPDTAR